MITGGTAVGLSVMNKMAQAQGPKMRVWLFKSYVTGGNDILARQVEEWAKERKVQVEFDWATFGDREQKFVAAIEAGNPPDIAEMNYQGPLRYRPALRDVSALAKDIAGARGGLLPYADRVVQFDGQYFAIARLGFGGGLHVRKDLIEAKGLKMPKVYDPDVVDIAKKTQDPSKDLWGFGQTLNRSDDARGFLQNMLWNYGGRRLGQGGQARAGDLESQGEHGGHPVRGRHDPEAQDPAARRDGLDRLHNNEAFMAGKLVMTNNGASLYYAMGAKKNPLYEKTQVAPHPGRAGRGIRLHGRLQLGPLQGQQARRAVRGSRALGRGREALRGVHEGVQRPGGPGLQGARRASLLEDRPELRGHEGEHPPRRVAWLSGPDHAGGHRGRRRSTSSATWAGASWWAGSRPRPALKEAHKRVEEIHRIRSRG